MVSNDLGTTARRFSIKQLEPETTYELKVKVNNPAGSTDFEHVFETVSSVEASGTQLGIGSNQVQGGVGQDLHDQVQLMVPVILGLLLVLVVIAGFTVCIKRSKF